MDTPPPSPAAERAARVAALVDEFYERRRAGQRLTPDTFLAEHPDVTQDLGSCLAALPLIELARVATPGSTLSAPPTPPAPLPAVPGYDLVEEIGRGGMGVVYKAWQHTTKRFVALKVMLGGPFAAPTARRRFEREVELAARLVHPHIVRVLESGFVADQQYYAMDYVPGVRLDRYLAAAQPDLRATLTLFATICESVDDAHAHGIIHRDLKPANILVDDQHQPHILDFGLAKAIDEAEGEAAVATRLSVSGQVLGTLAYLSPEQADAPAQEVDARTDVYALGVMLFEALTGVLPIDTTGRPSQVIQRILEIAPPRPSVLSPRVDHELETIILKALEKEKLRRYQSARALADDLRRYLAGEPILAQRPSSLYLLRKKLRRHRLAAGFAIVMLLLALGATAWYVRWRQQDWQRGRAMALRHVQDLEIQLQLSVGPAHATYVRYPTMPDAILAWARAEYLEPATRNSAIRFLEGELRRDPDLWPAAALLAEIYHAGGDSARAAQLRAHAERLAPDTADGWYVRSLATLEPAQALHCAGQAVRRGPQWILARYRLTDLQYRAGDLDAAQEGIARLRALGGDVGFCTLLQGHILARQGRYVDAIAEYNHVARLSPRAPEAYCHRAHMWQLLDKPAEAVADYTQVLELEGEARANVWNYYRRAIPLWRLGRIDEALADNRRARVLLGRPSYADARSYLMLREVNRTDEAQQVLTSALHETNDAWLAQILRCLAGQVPPEELTVLDPNDRQQFCEARYYAGEAWRLAGQPERARACFQQAVDTGLAFDPDVFPLTPMSEYVLARWRLEQLGGTPTSRP